ncbi:MAG: hypothetical protein EU544_00480 [Promethearchaeota archaeon]|nr:MAG: hypothetical protein EU544_00480 [Candidatus Lokiarchaeota archaeon]
MSIDKWLTEEEQEPSVEKTGQETHNSEELKDAKLQKIREIVSKNKSSENQEVRNQGRVVLHVSEENDFLNYIIKFKEWLNQRNYLKGDLDKLEVWVKNLYNKLELDPEDTHELVRDKKDLLNDLKKEFRDIPPQLLEEKVRIAINKKLRGTKKTSSDTYYLRKIKKITEEKLKEARYYKIVERILNL